MKKLIAAAATALLVSGAASAQTGGTTSPSNPQGTPGSQGSMRTTESTGQETGTTARMPHRATSSQATGKGRPESGSSEGGTSPSHYNYHQLRPDQGGYGGRGTTIGPHGPDCCGPKE